MRERRAAGRAARRVGARPQREVLEGLLERVEGVDRLERRRARGAERDLLDLVRGERLDEDRRFALAAALLYET